MADIRARLAPTHEGVKKPRRTVHLIAPERGPVRTEHGLTLIADHDFESAPAFDVLCVPGGPGIDGLLSTGRRR